MCAELEYRARFSVGTFVEPYGGQASSIRRIENLADASRFVDTVIHDRSANDHSWWIIVVGSMSPRSRKEVLDLLASTSNVAVRKLTSEDKRLQAGSAQVPVFSWNLAFQMLIAVPLWIWSAVLAVVALTGRVIGRGPRMYLLHIDMVPPPDPPGGAHVREPRRPSPPNDSLQR